MWRIMGLCFYGDKMHFVRQEEKTYDLDAIIGFLNRQGIALFDTCTKVVRTTNTASDKDLSVIEETDLRAMLRQLPCCEAVVTAGQLATEIACRQLDIAPTPRMGEHAGFLHDGRRLRLYRMPSSSRAYPMSIERKSLSYQSVFNILT